MPHPWGEREERGWSHGKEGSHRGSGNKWEEVRGQKCWGGSEKGEQIKVGRGGRKEE
jgi:hypothetical protein